MSERGRVGPVARALGFAGLLPQMVMVVGLMTLGDRIHGASWGFAGVAGLYAALILSFLGGMWWSLAMRRDIGQGRLAVLAVLPSLAAGAIVLFLGFRPELDWALIVLGSTIVLTLPVDRHLVTTGEAPQGWMKLRVPLSMGLGSLTIAAGIAESYNRSARAPYALSAVERNEARVLPLHAALIVENRAVTLLN